VGGGGKLYRDVPEKVSPTTAGNIINDSSKTLSSPVRQITVNVDNDSLRHLTATILRSSLKNDNLPSTSTKTCNVLFFTPILYLPPEQQTYSNDKDHLPSSPRRFNGLLLI